MNPRDNDFFLAGIIVTLHALQKLEGDLNQIDFDYIIEQKKRDLFTPTILKKIVSIPEEINFEKMS